MAFRLGNHIIEEIIRGVAQDFKDKLLYTLDELQNATINVTADSIEITDKKGNVVKRIYRSKTAELTSTSAFASPAIYAAGTGSDIQTASAETVIEMPKMFTVVAGATIDVADAKEGTIHVMGLYGSGANGAVLAQGTAAELDKTFGLVGTKLTVPAAGDDAPIMYLVKYQRDVESGIAIANYADKFPDTVRLTFQVAVVDPCDDTLRAGFLYIPSFTADPSTSINLDAENQEVDFNGNINVDMCGTEKLLYVLYFPDEDAVVTAVTGDETEEPAPAPPAPPEEDKEKEPPVVTDIMPEETVGDLTAKIDNVGVLTISGDGELEDGVFPWAGKAGQVTKVVIGDGVTAITATNAFDGIGSAGNGVDLQLPTTGFEFDKPDDEDTPWKGGYFKVA